MKLFHHYNTYFLIVFIIAFNYLPQYSSSQDLFQNRQTLFNESMFIQYITICNDDRDEHSHVLEFHLRTDSEVTYKLTDENADYFGWKNENNKTIIYLTKRLDKDEFKFLINAYVNNTNLLYSIRVDGDTKECGKPWDNSTCTVLIALLASLCLILFAGLSLALIVLRRKKPFKLSFRHKNDRENNEIASDNSSDFDKIEINNRKQSSYDIPNGIISNNSPQSSHSTINSDKNNSNSIVATGSTITGARKSSILKPPKIYENFEMINNNNNTDSIEEEDTIATYDNIAFVANENDDSENDKEPNPAQELPKDYLEIKRKSVVTFSNTTHVIQLRNGKQQSK